MIYRVGDGDNPAYDYSSQLKPAKSAESKEKFSLDRNREQEYAAGKRDKDKKAKEKPGASASSREREGVKLELSGGGREAEKAEEKPPSPARGEAGAASLFSFLQTFLSSVKAFLYRLWNEEAPEVSFSEDVTPEEAERLTEEYYALKGISPEERERPAEAEQANANDQASYEAKEAARDETIRKHLRTGNLEQVISLLTENGRRTPAKNSNLLTYYDKRGRLRQIGASDRERILHGDRRSRSL